MQEQLGECNPAACPLVFSSDFTVKGSWWEAPQEQTRKNRLLVKRFPDGLISSQLDHKFLKRTPESKTEDSPSLCWVRKSFGKSCFLTTGKTAGQMTYQEMLLRFKHDEILSSKNSLYSNLMETGVTILCKTGKNKIKKNSFLFLI